MSRLSALAALAAVPLLAAGPCATPGAAGRYAVDGGRVVRCAAGSAAATAAPADLAPATGLPAGLLSAWHDTTAGRLLAGYDGQGLWLSEDGGKAWTKISTKSGAGLELTSQRVGALLSARTAAGGVDLLAGMTGTANGGVYLSGDGGRHWMQINAGFDPANLSLSSLVKTSCAGCPVQSYSGSYGSGVYTRTFVVNPPPAVTGWRFGGAANAPCATAAATGPAAGGQPFKLCGAKFQNGVTVEFDGLPARGCTQSGGTSIACTATPAHAPGPVKVVIRNPDTRDTLLAVPYTYQ